MNVGDIVIKLQWLNGSPEREGTLTGLIIERDASRDQRSWKLEFPDLVYKILWSDGTIRWEVPGRVSKATSYLNGE
jgi:hypothetical protein